MEEVDKIKPEETKSNKKTSKNKVDNNVDDADEELINAEAGIEVSPSLTVYSEHFASSITALL